MEDENSILDATEYVLMALDNIKNYQEFIEYKEEITKAVYDIRKSITKLIQMKKTMSNNYNRQIKESNTSKANPSSISSLLGLKFNYDAYLKDIQLTNYSQNDNYFNNPNEDGNQNNNLNLNYIINNNENIPNERNQDKLNIERITFKDEDNNIIPSQSTEDNIIINKSIRNKFKIANNNNNNNNNINNIKNGKNIIPNQNQNNENSNKHKPINKKEKLSLIADLIMKINSEDYFYEILTKLFGEDLTDKLMSSDVSDELLEAVQNSIKEIEELKRKDDLKNMEQRNQMNNEELEEQPKRFPIEQIMNPNMKGENFPKNMKKSGSKENFGKNNKKFENKNNSTKKEKPFISATSVYGNYFDPPLQKGGMSKLDDYKK